MLSMRFEVIRNLTFLIRQGFSDCLQLFHNVFKTHGSFIFLVVFKSRLNYYLIERAKSRTIDVILGIYVSI